MLTTQETAPRISGNLYNCALNCALPTILDRIKTIAEQEQEQEQGVDFRHIDSYSKLKEMFEQWYCVDEMTWPGFSTFLNQFDFADQELILAPVLRMFLVEKTKNRHFGNIIEDPLQGFDRAFIKMLEGAGEPIPYQTPGRYACLEASIAHLHFYVHFGLAMRVHEYNNDTKEYTQLQFNDTELTPIDVFFKNGHYELSEHEKCPVWQYQNFNADDGPFALIQERISVDTSPWQTNVALAALREKILGHVQKPSALITPKQYQQNVDKYQLHDDRTVVIPIECQCIDDSETETKAKQSSATNDQENEEIINTKSISQQDFQDILKAYRTSYWLLNCIINIFSFGYYHHKSNTMIALEAIADKDQITSDMVKKALEQETPDSQHQRRLSFWVTNSNEPGKSGTDQVLKKLKEALTPK